MEESTILKILNRSNPWWSNREIPPSKIQSFERRDVHYYKTKDLLDEKVTAIVGPRRVGKTTALHQIINYLINERKIPPKNILYLSMDDTELPKENPLNSVLDVYSKLVIQKPLDSLKETHYIFLDEVHRVNQWSQNLKNWYDLGYNLKFMVSGSSSAYITVGSSESLLGRISTKIMLPLKFSELVRYYGIKDDFNGVNLRTDIFRGDLGKCDVDALFTRIQKYFGTCSQVKDNVEILLNQYLIKGGYPELLDEKDYSEISRILLEKLRLTFYNDILQLHEIRNPKVLEELFLVICKQSGSRSNTEKLRRDLGIERPTLKQYLSYLTDIFLISMSEFYSKSRVKRIKKEKKIYVHDAGIRNALTNYLDESVLDTEQVGILAESVAFDHLKRLKFNLEPGSQPEVFYWKHNSKEIDCVLEIQHKAIPFEIRYQSSVSNRDWNVVERFIEEFDSPYGFLITKDDLSLHENIILIPLWLFLMMI